MATSFVRQATRRRKWIAGLVAGALAAAVITVALAYWWSSARREKPLPAPQALPTNVQNQASGYTFTRSVEGRQIFTIHAARTVAFKQGGATVLEEVVVEVFGRQGNRHDVLRTRQCEYNPKTENFSTPGTVEIELNAPASGAGNRAQGEGAGSRANAVYLETSRLSFEKGGSLVVTEDPVQFRVGRARGSARGMQYSTRDGWLELEKDVAVELEARPTAAPAAPTRDTRLRPAAANRGGRAPIRLKASRLRYDAPPGKIGKATLEGPVEIVQATRRVSGERGEISLDNRHRVIRALLEGHVHGSDATAGKAMEASAGRVRGEFEPASGELRSVAAEGGVAAESRRGGRQETLSRMEAQQIEIAFRGARAKPQDGNATGDVKLSLESPARGAGGSGGEKKTLAAGQVHFIFRPEGKSLSQIQTGGAGTMTLVPADSNAGEREITAGRFTMGFDARSRIETLSGEAPTRLVFQPMRDAPRGTPAQVSSADRLEAAFDPATQSLAQVEQSGNFNLEDGDRRARADRASYASASQTLTLTGHPEVWDATSRIHAEHMIYDLRAGTAEGEGRVQATHFPGANEAAGDPTHILADRMRAERRSKFVHYEGRVRAWRGTDVVESSALDVSRTERRVSSGAGVLSSHYQPASGAPGGAPTSREAGRGESRPATIRADRLEFFDQGRKASYRGSVELRTENTTLKADRMEVYFSSARDAKTSEIARAVADGQVVVTQPSRRATGEHADYDAATGKIQLTGGPPRLEDAQKGTTSGQRLTFFIHDDRLIVDGGDESPALSQHRVAQ